MKKAKILKAIVLILILVTIFVAFSQNSCAALGGIGPIDEKFNNTGDLSNATNEATTLAGKIINIVQVVGAGIAIIMLVVLGIKWIGASPSGKAQIAKSARYYVLGAILIFAAVGLLQIIKNFTEKSIVTSV